jgi:hypothetical protein
MRHVIGLISCWALLLCSCAGGAEPDDQIEDSFTLPSAAGASAGAKSFAPSEAAVTGKLVFDDIEGGCSYLQAADGTRYEVIYPESWTADPSSAELRGPDEQLARAGDLVSVRGSIARDRSSTCQVGPIFVATDVEVRAR